MEATRDVLNTRLLLPLGETKLWTQRDERGEREGCARIWQVS